MRNKFNAEILADSITEDKTRITTMKVTFPRFILAEFNTHRQFSRNSASSRAIPFHRMVEMVNNEPFVPMAFQKNHKGMQGTDYVENEVSRQRRIDQWLYARDLAVLSASKLYNKLSQDERENDVDAYWGDQESLTKQICNRILEPFMWHTVIVTSTEWSNFFDLRSPSYTFNDEKDDFVFKSKRDAVSFFGKDEDVDYEDGSIKIEDLNTLQWLGANQAQAEIHIQAVTELMWDEMNKSEPNKLKPGEWHIPFGDNIDDDEQIDSILESWIDDKLSHNPTAHNLDNLMIKVAAARCARISYQTLGDKPKTDYRADLKLHDILSTSGHWSPFEHIAMVPKTKNIFNEGHTHMDKYGNYWSGNFRELIQYRHLIDKK